jgi:hypothetical protein
MRCLANLRAPSPSPSSVRLAWCARGAYLKATASFQPNKRRIIGDDADVADVVASGNGAAEQKGGGGGGGWDRKGDAAAAVRRVRRVPVPCVRVRSSIVCVYGVAASTVRACVRLRALACAASNGVVLPVRQHGSTGRWGGGGGERGSRSSPRAPSWVFALFAPARARDIPSARDAVVVVEAYCV